MLLFSKFRKRSRWLVALEEKGGGRAKGTAYNFYVSLLRLVVLRTAYLVGGWLDDSLAAMIKSTIAMTYLDLMGLDPGSIQLVIDHVFSTAVSVLQTEGYAIPLERQQVASMLSTQQIPTIGEVILFCNGAADYALFAAEVEGLVSESGETAYRKYLAPPKIEPSIAGGVSMDDPEFSVAPSGGISLGIADLQETVVPDPVFHESLPLEKEQPGALHKFEGGFGIKRLGSAQPRGMEEQPWAGQVSKPLLQSRVPKPKLTAGEKQFEREEKLKRTPSAARVAEIVEERVTGKPEGNFTLGLDEYVRARPNLAGLLASEVIADPADAKDIDHIKYMVARHIARVLAPKELGETTLAGVLDAMSGIQPFPWSSFRIEGHP